MNTISSVAVFFLSMVAVLLYAQPAHAAAIIAGITTGLIAVGFSAETAAVLAPLILTGVLGIGFNLALNAILAPDKPKSTNLSRSSEFNSIERSNNAPARIVYGTRKSSGVLVYAQATTFLGEPKKGGESMHCCLAVAHGPIYGIRDIMLNDEHGQAGRFAAYAYMIPFCGASDQEAISGKYVITSTNGKEVEAIVPKDWTSDCRLRGIAGLWFMLQWNTTIFPAGPPTVTMTVDGRLVYDPRDTSQIVDEPSTWRFSDNWALCIYDFLHNREFGMAYDDATIDRAAIIVAANISDQLVPNVEADGTVGTPAQSKRYTCNTIFESDAAPADVLSQMLAAGAGRLIMNCGIYYLYAGADTESSFDLTADDLSGPIAMSPNRSRENHVNTVTVTWSNPKKGWEPDSLPPITAPRYLSDDGGIELPAELGLLCVTDPYQAQRLGAIFFKQKQNSITVQWPGNLSLLSIAPGDVGTITLPDFGWDGKLFRVDDTTVAPDGAVTLSLTEHDPDIWDDGPIVNLPEPPDTTLPDPFFAPPPSAVSATEAPFVRRDGTRASKIVVTITRAATDSFFADYVIRYTRHGDTALMQTVHSIDDVVYIENCELGSYEISVTQRNTYGNESTPVYASVVVTFISAPPPGALALRYVPLTHNVRRYTWFPEAPLPADFFAWEVRFQHGFPGGDAAEQWETARPIGQSSRDNHLDAHNPTGSGDYTIYVRGVDRSGYLSNRVETAEITIAVSHPRIFESEYSALGWPGVQIDCHVNGAGELAAYQGVRWQDHTTWAAAGTWSEAGTVEVHFAYRPPTIDLGNLCTFAVSVSYDAIGEVDVQVRVSPDAELRERFHPISAMPLTGRYIQLCVQGHGVGAVTLRTLLVLVRAVEDYETIEDLNPAELPSTRIIARVENDAQTFGMAERQFNTYVNGNGHLQPRSRASLATVAEAGYIEVADSPALRLRDVFTLECAVRATADQGWKILMAKGPDWYIDWAVVLATPSQTFQLRASGFGGDDPAVDTEMGVADVFHWHHIAYTYDGATLRGYIDGVEQFAKAKAFTLAQTSNTLRVGHHCTGEIQDVRVWNASLSQPEIAGGINVPADHRDTRLVGYWAMDDLDGAVAQDRSLSANHGTRVGTLGRVRSATRESPILNLGVCAQYNRGLAVSWKRNVPGTAEITLEYSIDNGVTWKSMAGGNPKQIKDFAKGDDLVGKSLRVRMLLHSTSPTDTPELIEITTHFPVRRLTGDFAVVPTANFASITQAVVTAMQDTSVPLVATVIAKNPQAVRVRLTDLDGILRNAVVDLNLRGSRVLTV